MMAQSNHGHPIRIVNVSSKMHELAPGIDMVDPHFAKGRAYSSLAAYNRSKLAQVAIPETFIYKDVQRTLIFAYSIHLT
jgi:hypothetical protein